MNRDGWIGFTIVFIIAVGIMWLPRGAAISAEAVQSSVQPQAVYDLKPTCRAHEGTEASNCLYYRQALAAEAAVREARTSRIWGAVTGAVAILLSFAGVLAALKSLKHTQQSAQAALETAKAAQQQFKSDRARMVLNNCEMKLTSRFEMNAIISWKNDGNTPALGVEYRTVCTTIPLNTVPLIRKDEARIWNVARSVISSKEISGPVVAVMGGFDILTVAKNSGRAVVVFAAVYYRDVFDPEIERFSEYYLFPVRGEDQNIHFADFGHIKMT